MASIAETRTQSRVTPGFALLVGLLGALTVVRLVGLHFSAVDFFFDEAQYWTWSRELAFGYFSKPPLLAWVIAAAEQVCGSSEACIRAPAPILYFGTSLLVYAVARQHYDGRVAFFAALSTALATGTVFSARIISTDVPLLFFWALALLAYLKLLAGGDARWTALLGVALGLGLMAKYAMIYFLPGAALAAWLDPDARRFLRTPAPWIALLIAAVIVTPNVIWNIENGLATFRHTGDNIEGAGAVFEPSKGFEFIGGQLLVFGPIVFCILLAAFARVASPTTERADRLMLAFSIPPLALVTVLAFITRAQANWAAPAFISAAVVVVAILIRSKAWKWLMLSLGIGVAAQAAFLASDAIAPRLHLPGLSDGDVYHRTLGWRALGENTGAIARRLGIRSIVGESRDDEASLFYYWRDQPEKVYAWAHSKVPDHQFDLTHPLNDATPRPLLFVTRCVFMDRLSEHFATVQIVGSFKAPTGPKTWRNYVAFRLDRPKGPIGPLAECK